METFFSSSFPVGSATGKQRNPDMKSPLVFGGGAGKSCHSAVFALLRLIFSLQFSLLIANFSSASKSLSTSAFFLLSPTLPKSWCFEKPPQMGKGETHMLVFDLLEILSSRCYWAGRLPGSCGHAAGDSALRTGPTDRGAPGRCPAPGPTWGARLSGGPAALSPGQDFRASRTPVLLGEDRGRESLNCSAPGAPMSAQSSA